MNNHYKYKLEKYSTPANRYACPACGHRRKFTRYVDAGTGRYLGQHVGRCDRIDSCAYHFTPAMYFADHPELRSVADFPAGQKPAYNKKRVLPPAAQAPEPPISYIPMLDVYDSWGDDMPNHLIQWLYDRYDRMEVLRRLSDYGLGTSGYWPGATIWWQMDREGRCRTGKIMLYDRATGRRVREPFPHVTWAHTALGLKGYQLSQCLFGEHLLALDKYRRKPVAIVESEKSAVIASLHIPDYLWMAAGGKEMLSLDRLEVLRGREVILFPDAGGYELWSQRAQDCENRGIKTRVSRMMMNGKEGGSDIADYLFSE